MSSFYAGLLAWLPTQGITTVPVIVGELPAEVYEAVIIAPTGSWKKPAPLIEARFPSVQITVVSRSYSTAEATAQAIFALLNGTGPHTMGTQPVGRVYAAQDPFPLAADARQRHRWVCNYNAVT